MLNNDYTPSKRKNFENTVRQYVIRNYDKKGYETVYSSTEEDLPVHLLPLILPKNSIERWQSYFLKWPLKESFDEDTTLVKLVIGDGIDKFGRNKAKIFILIIPNEVYEDNGLLYYASPIWSNKLSLEDDDPLTVDDFEKISIKSPKILIKKLHINITLVEEIVSELLLNKHVLITNDRSSESESATLNKTLAFVDYCLPEFFRNKISIKTSSNKKNYLFANCCVLNKKVLPKELQRNEVIINVTKILNGDIEGNNSKGSLQIVKSLLQATSASEKRKIGKIFFDQNRIISEKLIPPDLYKKILNRFGIKSKNGAGLSHLLTQIKNNIR